MVHQLSLRFDEALTQYGELLVQNPRLSISRLLPLIFQLRGQPYSLGRSHFMFEPMFRVRELPRLGLLCCGRQVSKCLRVHGLGALYLANGRPVTGGEISVGTQVLGFDETSLTTTTGTVTRIYDAGTKPTYRVTTRLGTVLDVGEEHPFRAPLGYVSLNKLKVGDNIAAVRTGARFTDDESVPDARVALTAFMIGDGCCGCSGNFNFVSNCNESIELFKYYYNDDRIRVRSKQRTSALSLCLSRVHILAEWLKQDGLWNHKSYDKFIPNWVFDLNEKATTLFLNCLWSTDGMVKPRSCGYTISYCSTSRKLAFGVKALLLKFGIISRVTQRSSYCAGKRHRDAYLVRVEGRRAQEKFLTCFQPPGKTLSIRQDLPPESSNRDTLPMEFSQVIWDLCDKVSYTKTGATLRDVGLRRTIKYSLTHGKLQQYIDFLQSHNQDVSALIRLQNSETIWDSIVSIEPIGDAPCWDLEVEGCHNYVVDGVISHNSTSLAASQILRSYIQDNYNILTVMPLFEQVRKFSQNYVRPFIITSGIKEDLIGDLKSDSVLQRAIGRQSNLFYSYSSGDPNRVRGIPADECNFDECQDLDMADIPIIESCMGASPFKIVRYTGTPKTFDNTIHLLWEDSSQAHWHIPCTGCSHENVAAADSDLLKMIGDNSLRNDGTRRTLICAKCGDPLNSRAGFYIHRYPEKRQTFPSYHVPQVILPMHYESPKEWQVLLDVQRDKPQYIFYNEVLGESFDLGAKILTQDDIKKAAVVEPCLPENMPHGQYIAQAVGVDWGGRGKEKTSDTDDFISNTAIALAGMRPGGVIEVKYLHKVPYATDMGHEASMAAEVAAMSHSEWLALDYGGQGNVQEQQVRASGWPVERIMPFTYAVMKPRRPIVFYEPPKHRGVRSSYTLDKPRSILLLADLIKRGLVLLPKSDRYLSDHLRDLLNVYEESMDNPSGSPRRLVKRMSRRTDDVLHAINFAVMCLYHATNAWPRIAQSFTDHPLNT